MQINQILRKTEKVRFMILVISPYEPRRVKTGFFEYAKTKAQISFAKLISAFVIGTRIIQFLYFLNLKVQASSHLL